MSLDALKVVFCDFDTTRSGLFTAFPTFACRPSRMSKSVTSLKNKRESLEAERVSLRALEASVKELADQVWGFYWVVIS